MGAPSTQAANLGGAAQIEVGKIEYYGARREVGDKRAGNGKFLACRVGIFVEINR
jgi:hypothetical protein